MAITICNAGWAEPVYIWSCKPEKTAEHEF